MLVDADGVKPKLLLQAVPEPKTAENRMHLDIDTPDLEAEVARLEALGARRLEAGVRSEHGTNWVIMADPEGNDFCVCDGGDGGGSGG
jgi:predicted enzyme related to lactoylglutathione lyase